MWPRHLQRVTYLLAYGWVYCKRAEGRRRGVRVLSCAARLAAAGAGARGTAGRGAVRRSYGASSDPRVSHRFVPACVMPAWRYRAPAHRKDKGPVHDVTPVSQHRPLNRVPPAQRGQPACQRIFYQHGALVRGMHPARRQRTDLGDQRRRDPAQAPIAAAWLGVCPAARVGPPRDLARLGERRLDQRRPPRVQHRLCPARGDRFRHHHAVLQRVAERSQHERPLAAGPLRAART